MKKYIVTLLIFISILISSLYFGLPRLQYFSGVDEPYWSYERVPDFWKAVKKMEWKKTEPCDKPGVMTVVISGAGLPFIDGSPKDYKSLRYKPKTSEQVQEIRDIYFKLRSPIFIFTLLMLPVFYWLIKKLLGTTIARFSLIFMGFSPILLGISLIINTDSILWILTGLSSLSLFVFLKNQEKKYLILSGFLLGLSVITKFVANVLFIYFFVLFILDYIFYAHPKTDIKNYLKNAFLNYAILFATAMLTAFVFFPAAWVKISVLMKYTLKHEVFSATWPFFAGFIFLILLDFFIFKVKFSNMVFGFLAKYKLILAKIVGSFFVLMTFLVFLHVFGMLHIFDIQGLISSPKGIGDGNALYRFSGAVTSDFFSLLFSISPLILISILASAISLFREKEIKRDSITAIYIIMFIFMFYLGSAVNDVTTTVRYQIMTYPLVFVLAAIGISYILKNEKIKKYFSVTMAYVFCTIVLLASLFFIKPNFLAYASEILPQDLIVNLKGMGEGSIEAADYLNQLPGAHEMVIWSDKGAVCEAFVGRCFIDFKRKTFAENNIDYFVVSTDRMSRTLKLSKGIKLVDEEKIRAKEDLTEYVNFERIYAEENPEFEIIIGDRKVNFVKAIKTEKLFNQ